MPTLTGPLRGHLAGARVADQANKLFYGDNLDVLRAMPPESVDLVYLDPPFNSNREYNAIFRDESGNQSDAQIKAFTDTWSWGPTPDRHLTFLTNSALHRGVVPDPLAQLIGAFTFALGKSPILAYLVEMSVRLIELRRVLRETGSLYLHCDPTASHYLKLILDAVLGPENFRNEIIWKRSSAHSDTGQGARHFGRVSDTILFYSKGDKPTWNQQYAPYDEQYLADNYKRKDPDGRVFRIDNIQGPGGASKGNPRYEFLGVTRYWRYSRERMQELYDNGRIIQTRVGAVPQYKRYLDEMPGVPIQNIWTDISVINNRSKEMVGWPTQKPLALLERIIATSSNPGDTVLDPFCGCGTAVVAAQKMDRRWLGIDITYLAIAVMRARLRAAFPDIGPIQIENRPTEYEGARRMATETPDGRYQFQWWALDEIGALPRTDDRRKGPDQGIDGTIMFTDADGPQTVVISVKSGHPRLDDVRVLRAVVEAQGAAIGVLATLDDPTPQMRQDAAAAGLWHSGYYDRDYPRIQILTAKDIIERRARPDIPPLVAAPYRVPPKVKVAEDQETIWQSRQPVID